MKVAMLSTSDNPYNPFIQYDEWYAYDHLMGYNSCEYLDRVAKVSSELEGDYQNLMLTYAIDEIVNMNLIGLDTDFKVNYVKIEKEK